MLDRIKVTVAITVVIFILGGDGLCQNADPLLFPKDDFTVETRIVNTSAGKKEVIYHSYLHIPYVANPVDKDYQSLNVSVPVKVENVDVDASYAPILLRIGVGGYMSSNNAHSGSDNFSSGGTGKNSEISGNADLALAEGYVVVTPGCRGRDNQASDGTYYGKAPAAIVDLKAAVRYIRHNKGIMPGNVNWIFSTGISAGGALSALLGASGNSNLYDSYLQDIGAAGEDDNIFGSACFCPIADLEHSDGAYEWMYGNIPVRSGLVNQDLSQQLKTSYGDYQSSLNLQGKNGFGTITADNYHTYLMNYYLVPSADKYLRNLDEYRREEYLENNRWLTWTEKGAVFNFADYVSHVGRMKGLPAFDDFDMSQPEPNLFGNYTTDARHFTNFSLQHATGNKNAEIEDDLKLLVNMMNPMYFICNDNPYCAQNWWLRQGTSDNHTSQTIIINLATCLENRNKKVNTFLYWDAGHGADEDPEEFIAWIGKVTGFSSKNNTDR